MALYEPDNDYFVLEKTQADADGVIKPAYGNGILRGGYGGGYLAPRFTIDTAANTYAANDLFLLAVIPVESFVVAEDSWVDHDNMGTTLTLDVTTIDIAATTASTTLWASAITLGSAGSSKTVFTGGSAQRDIEANIPSTVNQTLLVASISVVTAIINGTDMQFYIKIQN